MEFTMVTLTLTAVVHRLTFSLLVQHTCDQVALCIWPLAASSLIPCLAACPMES